MFNQFIKKVKVEDLTPKKYIDFGFICILCFLFGFSVCDFIYYLFIQTL